jgi:hypothetical protein
MVDEVILLTETKKQLIARQKAKVVTAEKVYSLDTLTSNAEILKQLGGQAALVFRAIVGSYWISGPDHRDQGFTIHPVFQRATNLQSRQIQRACQKLEAEGYIERKSRAGCKSRILLTQKGYGSLAKKPQ